MRNRALLSATLATLATAAFGQGDPLVSKSVRLLADRERVWAFADGGLDYSRIDLFTDPPAISNGSLDFRSGIWGGAGRERSLLVYFNYLTPDTAKVGGIASLDRDGNTVLDSILFQPASGQNNSINSGVEISALALWRDTVVIGGGRAGFALSRLRPEGQGALDADSLRFQALPSGVDTVSVQLRCALGAACQVNLTDFAQNVGEPDSVTVLAVDSAAADSVWLLVGTQAGLRRGILGGRAFPRVVLPGDSAGQRVRIEGIHVDSRRSLLWVFTGSRYYYSDDHGRTFRVPPDLPGVATRLSTTLSGFSPAPEAANIGDTTFINFNIDQAGLVMFRNDTVLANAGSEPPFDILVSAEDGLDVSLTQGRPTNLAVVSGGAFTALALGTTKKGLFFRFFGPGQGPEWRNINSLKRLRGGLDEVITYPTLFTGTGPGGEVEYVQIGYRLKKNGRVTITVYNYAMEKVKTIVSKARRLGGGGRSENPDEDRWDGRDRSGRLVSVGTYYILVESDQGEKGWGKAIHIRGRN
jgi:hypothetical protein